MASLIEELLDTLTEQRQNYDELLVLSVEKANTIKNHDMELLQKITAAEFAIIGKNQKLDVKREEIVANVGIVLNQDPQGLTITKIAEIIKDQKESAPLIALRDDLERILVSLKEATERNKVLIETSLDSINFSVSLALENSQGGKEYLSQTGEVMHDDKNFFDAKQ